MKDINSRYHRIAVLLIKSLELKLRKANTIGHELVTGAQCKQQKATRRWNLSVQSPQQKIFFFFFLFFFRCRQQ